MAGLSRVSAYESMGIETRWEPIEHICLNSARVIYSNDMSKLLFDLTCAIITTDAPKTMNYSHGWPQRFTLLLSESEPQRAQALAELKRDSALAGDVLFLLLMGVYTCPHPPDSTHMILDLWVPSLNNLGPMGVELEQSWTYGCRT